MKLAELARELKIPTDSFIRFIQDFDLELSDCITTGFEVKKDFEKFARENISFLQKYAADLDKKKSVEDIAETIHQPAAEVAEAIRKQKPQIFNNGRYQSSVSSFGIDNKLGGNYQFVYKYFGDTTRLDKREFIGYRDLFFFISEALEPFLNDVSVENWGIHRPSGIILYGPPGSGKIFWAGKIAEIVGFDFKEIRKHYLGTSLAEENKPDFNNFLVKMMEQEKVLLFFENFDMAMADRSDEETGENCDQETKDIVLHYISHFEEENVLMVGAANSLRRIDDELLAPGRFDVQIPIFPPNKKERAEMILYNMTEELSEDSLLLKILKHNKAHLVPFWKETAAEMRVYSNTMVVDFTQSLKKRIRNQYMKENSTEITISKEMLSASLRDAATKLTPKYLNQVESFLKEAAYHQYKRFSARIDQLTEELQTYRIVEEPKKAIGFTHNHSSDSPE